MSAVRTIPGERWNLEFSPEVTAELRELVEAGELDAAADKIHAVIVDHLAERVMATALEHSR